MEPFIGLWMRAGCSFVWVNQYKLSVSTYLLNYLVSLSLAYIDTIYHTSVILKNLCQNTILSIIGWQYFWFHKSWFYSLDDTVNNLVFCISICEKQLLAKKKILFYLTYYSTYCVISIIPYFNQIKFWQKNKIKVIFFIS